MDSIIAIGHSRLTNKTCKRSWLRLTAMMLLMVAVATGAPAESKAADKSEKAYRGKRSVVQWMAKAHSSVAPGSQTYLWFTAKPDASYHVYKARVDDENSATNFAVTQKSKLKVGTPVTKSKVISKPIAPGLPQMQHYHDGTVTWTLPIDVPANTPPGNYVIEGFIGYQACTDNACMQPEALKFSAKVTVGQNGGTSSPIVLQAAKRGEALDAATAKWVDNVKANDKAVPDVKK